MYLMLTINNNWCSHLSTLFCNRIFFCLFASIDFPSNFTVSPIAICLSVFFMAGLLSIKCQIKIKALQIQIIKFKRIRFRCQNVEIGFFSSCFNRYEFSVCILSLILDNYSGIFHLHQNYLRYLLYWYQKILKQINTRNYRDD